MIRQKIFQLGMTGLSLLAAWSVGRMILGITLKQTWVWPWPISLRILIRSLMEGNKWLLWTWKICTALRSLSAWKLWSLWIQIKARDPQSNSRGDWTRNGQVWQTVTGPLWRNQSTPASSRQINPKPRPGSLSQIRAILIQASLVPRTMTESNYLRGLFRQPPRPPGCPHSLARKSQPKCIGAQAEMPGSMEPQKP